MIQMKKIDIKTLERAYNGKYQFRINAKKRLAYFRLSKKHIGLYFPTPVIAEHKKELKGYGTSTATVRFPLDKKLPAALIKKLVKARVNKNETKNSNKK